MNSLINQDNQNVTVAEKLIHDTGIEEAARLLKSLFKNYDGRLTMRLWNGINLKLGKGIAEDFSHSFILICRNPSIVRDMVLGKDPLRLANAYFHGDIDIEG